ncbi:MAG TPA: acyltransferase [Verrucomicrobiae bacterium]|nr:acyltransferase [Verrucomicrobiae bacterium]
MRAAEPSTTHSGHLVPRRGSLGYRPALDGIRGLAILAVVAAHAGFTNGSAAFVGVDVFFVLSGFLITTLLVEEWDYLGDIDLRLFYWRRALRILPALILVCCAFTAVAWITEPRSDALEVTLDGVYSLCYVANWVRVFGHLQASLFAHTWSLGIEEQFYLVWPLALILLLRRTESRKSLAYWLVLVIVLVNVYRIVFFTEEFRISRGTDTRADALMIGALAGILFSSNLISQACWFRRLSTSAGFVSMSGLLLISVFDWFRRDINIFVRCIYPLVSLFGAALIMELLNSPDGWMCKVLSRRYLVYLGRISYGLYLWHYPIFRLIEARSLSRTAELSLELSISLAVTILCYHFVEKPILKYKRRATPWQMASR